MNLRIAVSTFAIAAISGIVGAQQYTIRVSLGTMAAEVVSVNEQADGLVFETITPDGASKVGLWDAVTGDDGVLRGVRILDAPQLNAEGNYVVDATKIAIRSRGTPFEEGLSRRVPEVFLADPASRPLEVSWVTDSEFDYTVGTHPADEDPATVPVFTRTSDGEIRRGLWEENAKDEPVVRLFVNGPFRGTLLEDGTIEFLVGRMGRHRRSGEFPPGHMVHNRTFDVFPIEGFEEVAQHGKVEEGPVQVRDGHRLQRRGCLEQPVP